MMETSLFALGDYASVFVTGLLLDLHLDLISLSLHGSLPVIAYLHSVEATLGGR